jgi:hypothetical protein
MSTNAPTFSKVCKVRRAYSVNANGNIYMRIAPAYAAVGSTGGFSPLLVLNDDIYNPNGTVDYSALITVFDNGFSDDVLKLTLGVFDTVNTTTFNLKIGMTGVNNLNRKGVLHIAEDRDDRVIYGRNDALGSAASLIVNDNSLTNISALYHYKDFSATTSDLAHIATYHYIPENSYADPVKISPSNSTTTNVLSTQSSTKQLIIIGTGLDPETQIVLDYEIVLECEPELSQLSNYRPSYSHVFENPDPYLFYLNTKKDLIIKDKNFSDHKVNSVLASANSVINQQAKSNKFKNVTGKVKYLEM